MKTSCSFPLEEGIKRSNPDRKASGKNWIKMPIAEKCEELVLCELVSRRRKLHERRKWFEMTILTKKRGASPF